MKTIIVGGVAGGASCAARLRRLDETAEIVVLERGPYVSFANCGLPYHVGGVIPTEEALFLADPALFRARFEIEVRTGAEVVAIDRASKVVRVRDVASGVVGEERYDRLVLSPGAQPIRPPLPGMDLPGIFTVRAVPDARAIRAWMENTNARRAVVVGGGFIGLEMAENLVHRGLEVTVVEKLDQVMPPLDPEIAAVVGGHLEKHGVRLALGDGVAGFEAVAGGGLEVLTESGARHAADVVILSIGVRPETALAKAAGLELGERGGIRVNERMQTSDPDIFAVGDAVEVRDFVLGTPTLIPLAGPANRQGRLVADVIAGRAARFRGTQGTAVCGVFGLAVASTGASEKGLRRAGLEDFEKIYLHPNSHAGYYPGAKRISMKVLFRKSDGRLLGAQAVGEDGAERRIDVIAMAIQLGGTVYDLEEAELCYAPQYGGAKDAVNYAGMVAADVLRDDMPLVHWEGVGGELLVDVREPGEFATGHAPGAVNIPLGSLRARLGELPRDRAVAVYCGVGQRGYYATRILRQRGYRVRNVSGGLLSRPRG